MSTTTNQILHQVATVGEATAGQIAAALDMTKSTACAHLKNLFDEGRLDREKPYGSPFVYRPAKGKRKAQKAEVAKLKLPPAEKAECRSVPPEEHVEARTRPTMQDVLEYVRENPGSTADQVAEGLGCPSMLREFALRELSDLWRRGIVRRELGDHCVFRYEVAKVQEAKPERKPVDVTNSEPAAKVNGAGFVPQKVVVDAMTHDASGARIDDEPVSSEPIDRLVSKLERQIMHRPKPPEGIELGLACIDKLCDLLSDDIATELHKVGTFVRQVLR